MMSLRSDIAHREQRLRTDLTLNGQLIFLGIGQNIFVVKRRRRADRLEARPIDRSTGCRKRHWENLRFIVAGSAIYERCNKFRRHWAAVEGAERSVSNFIEVGRAFKR